MRKRLRAAADATLGLAVVCGLLTLAVGIFIAVSDDTSDGTKTLIIGGSVFLATVLVGGAYMHRRLTT